MSAVFYLEPDGSAGGGQTLAPSKAISILSGQAPGVVRSLIEVSGGQGYSRSISLRGAQAILMMGMTPELEAAVEAAIADQVNGIFVQDDYLVIYYLRTAERTTFRTITRTVACIAGRRYYWGLPDEQGDDSNVQAWGWGLLYPMGNDQWIHNGTMALQTLRDVLGRCHGAEAWLDNEGQPLT
jgi:hypothetical protein